MNNNSITIDIDIPNDVLFICQTLIAKGYEAYLVGGALRDAIYFNNNKTMLSDIDYDIATNATPDIVIEIFKNDKIFTIPTGLKHGTVTTVINSVNYEITTYRIDGEYRDGRRPENILYSDSIEEDLSRRDFTINAMAYDVINKKLLDPCGGIQDLKNKIIRSVGDPVKRFSEDGLRPVRACRFSAYLNFEIEQETFDAINKTIHIIKKVSMERIRDEFFKLMKAEKPSIGLENMRKSGLLDLFLPELMEGYEVSQNKFHSYDVYWHNVHSCDNANRRKPLVRFAALFHDMGKPRAKNFAIKIGNGNVFYNHEVISEKMTWKILKRFKFSNTARNRILKLVRMHMFYYTAKWSDGAVRRFLRNIDGNMEFLEDLFDLRRADRLGSGTKTSESKILAKFLNRISVIIEQDNAFKVTDLDMNGNNIIEYYNIKPGKIIGEMLEYMLQQVLDDPTLNEKEKLFEIGTEFLEKERK